MLRELHIRNLAVIEEARIELAEGLNCFTGQTGAGKSLVLGAFEMLLGLRTGNMSDVIRAGCEEARVSGIFELYDQAVCNEIAEILDVELQPGEPLLITRKIFNSGRSSFSINGQPATAPMIQRVGQRLVDVHGQHEHQYLLKPSNQLTILDDFASLSETRTKFSRLYQQLHSLHERRKELVAGSKLRSQQLELYEFQADEIDAANPTAGEFPELKSRQKLLANLKEIKEKAGHAYAALYDNEGSCVDRLQAVTQVLLDLAEMDESLAPVAEQVRAATLSLQDAAFDLSRHSQRLDLDPEELAEVEDRMNALNRLISKYARDGKAGDDPLQPVLDYRQQIGEEIDSLVADTADLEGIDKQIKLIEEELIKLGDQLTTSRRDAAESLQPLVDAQLSELGMPEAQLTVAITVADPHEDAFGPTGFDQIEFMIRPNPGQPARPLRKIASGGELSRIMLAIKSILAESDRISVLVFDEIDANIGGRLGNVIGQKLRELASPPARKTHQKKTKDQAGSDHQILCITHLPQIAAYADRHIRIRKAVEAKGANEGETRTTVEVIEGDHRIDELAEMLAGQTVTDTTRQQVRDMISSARM